MENFNIVTLTLIFLTIRGHRLSQKIHILTIDINYNIQQQYCFMHKLLVNIFH